MESRRFFLCLTCCWLWFPFGRGCFGRFSWKFPFLAIENGYIFFPAAVCCWCWKFPLRHMPCHFRVVFFRKKNSARISKFGKLDMAVILNVTLCFFLVLCVAVVTLSAFTCLSIGIFWPMFEGHKTLSTTLDTFGPRDARIPFMSKKSPK